MLRWSLAIALVASVCWFSADSAQAQLFQQLPNGQVVQVIPHPHTVPNYYWVPNNFAPINHSFGVVHYNRYPIYNGWNQVRIQRSQVQLDPMRHFFNGNGSSYSPGTSQIWSRSR